VSAYYAKLITHRLPQASEEKYHEFYEVCVIEPQGRAIQSVLYVGTLMRNYWPKTEQEMAKNEAEYAAKGMAKKLGIDLVIGDAK
jgi:RPA family protein